MNTKLLTSLVVIAILLGGYGVVKPKVVNNTQEFGALAGPDIPSPYLKWGNLEHLADHPSFSTATTTVCTIGPATATTSIKKLALQVTTATNTAVTITLATSTASNASTTFLYAFSLAANKLGAWDWAPTTTEKAIIGTGDQVNVTVTGFRPNSSVTNLFLGDCSADTIKL